MPGVGKEMRSSLFYFFCIPDHIAYYLSIGMQKVDINPNFHKQRVSLQEEWELEVNGHLLVFKRDFADDRL